LAALGGGIAYTARKRAKQKQQPRVKTASSGGEWARNNGLRDELQKISSFAGLVMSQLARREVMPAAKSVLDRAEEKAARKVQALRSADSPMQAILPTSPFE
jgi:hypothetical protein